MPAKKKRAPYGYVKAAKLAALEAKLPTPAPKHDFSSSILYLQDKIHRHQGSIEECNQMIASWEEDREEYKKLLADTNAAIDLLKSQ